MTFNQTANGVERAFDHPVNINALYRIFRAGRIKAATAPWPQKGIFRRTDPKTIKQNQSQRQISWQVQYRFVNRSHQRIFIFSGLRSHRPGETFAPVPRRTSLEIFCGPERRSRNARAIRADAGEIVPGTAVCTGCAQRPSRPGVKRRHPGGE